MKTLRIFLVWEGRATTVANSNIWLRNIYDSLVKQGHDVFLFDIQAYAKEVGLPPDHRSARDRLTSNLPNIFLTEHKKKAFNIFFSYLHIKQILPEAIKEIKKHIFTINYTTNFHQFNLYEELATIYHLNIYISKIAGESFESIGARSYWMPFAANLEFYKPSNKIKNNNIVFVGSMYGIRPNYLWRVLQSGLNLHIYGPGWNYSTLRTLYRKGKHALFIFKSHRDSVIESENILRKLTVDTIARDYPMQIHGPLSDAEYVHCLSDSLIVINIQESRFQHNYMNNNVLHGINLRDFETTMSGSFLCTQYSDEVQYFFEDGKEVITFQNDFDLIEKLRYYSQRPNLCEKIALAGHKRALSDHTWQNRFEKLFSDNVKDF